MMRVDMPVPLAPGETFSFDVKWWYNINDHVNYGGRSGYEFFPEDGNSMYNIAQFFPAWPSITTSKAGRTSSFWER